MSENLFINATHELQRMEALLQAKCKSYTVSHHKQLVAPVNGKDARVLYFATIVYVKKDGSSCMHNVEGDSFPDLYSKISDKL